jgi:hypothetical protein
VAIEDLGLRRGITRAAGPNRRNPSIHDQERHAGSGRMAGTVDYRDITDHHGFRQRTLSKRKRHSEKAKRNVPET